MLRLFTIFQLELSQVYTLNCSSYSYIYIFELNTSIEKFFCVIILYQTFVLKITPIGRNTKISTYFFLIIFFFGIYCV